MPDNLTDLQRAVQQRRLEQRGHGDPRWLTVLVRLQRLTTWAGILILLGVTASVVWPHLRQLQKQPAPQPQAPAGIAATTRPAVEPGPTGPGAPEPPPSANSPSEPGLAEALAAGLRTYRVNQAFGLAGWEYRVTSYQWRDVLPNGQGRTLLPSPNHRFLTVFLAARNTGHETALLPPARLLGPDNTRYEPWSGPAGRIAVASQPVGPAALHVQQVTFEVPAGRPYKLLLQGGWLSDRYAAVEIRP